MTIQDIINRLEKIRSEIEGDNYTYEELTSLIKDLTGFAPAPSEK